MAGYRMNAPHIRRALDSIAGRDASVARALAEVGYPAPRRHPEGFATLLRVIVGQQVSVAAAAAISARLNGAMRDDITPGRMLRMRAETLRKAGLSKPKVRYVRELALAVDKGELDLEELSRLPDDEALQHIQAVPGLGLWSAQIYLMFSLGRPDVWPAADVGALRGLQFIKGSSERPTRQDGERLVEEYRPHRSAMALLAWKCAGGIAPAQRGRK